MRRPDDVTEVDGSYGRSAREEGQSFWPYTKLNFVHVDTASHQLIVLSCLVSKSLSFLKTLELTFAF
jgi:hypothetical protein